MDWFVTWNDNPGLTMSYFDATNMPEGLPFNNAGVTPASPRPPATFRAGLCFFDRRS